MTGHSPASDRDLANILKILGGLKPIEVEALDRFYIQGQDTARVAEDLGIAISRFVKLKLRVKQAYLAMEKPD
jgi:hypothetical protein